MFSVRQTQLISIPYYIPSLLTSSVSVLRRKTSFVTVSDPSCLRTYMKRAFRSFFLPPLHSKDAKLERDVAVPPSVSIDLISLFHTSWRTWITDDAAWQLILSRIWMKYCIIQLPNPWKSLWATQKRTMFPINKQLLLNRRSGTISVSLYFI